ncbi:hypothetical protein L6164_016937 [Bauhinia variegata]|uniref:Uncharacterized protein n=1 Tax=Bauhinia variegata TaxID=167791 RepID=A0ACB9N676_BAUVA|nr:hypothetical protein L6164_016937 [Bauhinia variegata]
MEVQADQGSEIVIVGAGICGLATALALHRKGVRSLVLESAECLRAYGAGIAVLTNGWCALEQLGVASKLRKTTISLQGVVDISVESGKQRKSPLSKGEARCIKRSDLVKTLADELPPGTIRFGCRVLSVKMATSISFPILQLEDGSSIEAKVLIGCDGANSVVAKFLKLKPNKIFPGYAVRGFTHYPDGHGLAPELVRLRAKQLLLGRSPVNDKLAFWFVLNQGDPIDAHAAKDPEIIRQLTLRTIVGCPTEIVEMVKKSDLESLSLTYLRYTSTWDLIVGRFHQGTVALAGDAMHMMVPFIGQGGSAAIEDAIVLARCLTKRLNGYDSVKNEREILMQKLVGEALDEYVEERRMRLLWLSVQGYLIGLLLTTNSMLVKLMVLIPIVFLFRDPTRHTGYDCGEL